MAEATAGGLVASARACWEDLVVDFALGVVWLIALFAFSRKEGPRFG